MPPGPRRKTKAELEASGALKHDPARYADRVAHEPEPEPGATPPPGLSDLALKHWPDTAKILTDARVLTCMDALGLGMFCEAYTEWRIAMDKVVAARPGAPERLVQTQLDKAHHRLLELLRDFGMTPASRTRVQAQPKKPSENKYGALARKRHNSGE